ncbi:polysaccharide biosynthesis C-terminal domain-containing protein, partial [Pelagibacteraceae bacterium]|nr:polysaccharide biosynthesis C-terminal domain-containing protein [Pelagibacteraceae bacterium]
DVSAVNNSKIKKIENDYIHRQTLKNSYRYTTKILVEISENILNANFKVQEIENSIYANLLNDTLLISDKILEIANLIARIDVSFSWAIYARKYDAVNPEVNNRYALWSFSPIILNLFMIGAMGLSYYYSLITSLILSWAVLISGLLQILIIFFWARRKKIKLSLVRPKLTKNIKSLFKLLLPNILAGGIIQINQFIGVMFASSITGAISWLYYADRIVQLPLGVFVISISTILLTLLSKYEANKNKLKIKKQIDSSCVLMFVLTTISMIGLFAISDLIVDILFKRGKFGLGDVIATSDAIVMYAIGLPAFGFIKIFSVIFFAKQNTLTPFKVSSISMIINLILIFLLVNKLGHLGIALSLSLSSWINAALLYFFLWKKNYWRFDKILIIKVFKIIICSFITYTVLSIFYMLVLYTDYLTLNDFIIKVLLLSFLIFFSATLFFSLLRVMGIISFDKNKIKTFLKGERK